MLYHASGQLLMTDQNKNPDVLSIKSYVKADRTDQHFVRIINSLLKTAKGIISIGRKTRLEQFSNWFQNS